jgi:hypothetical protein
MIKHKDTLAARVGISESRARELRWMFESLERGCDHYLGDKPLTQLEQDVITQCSQLDRDPDFVFGPNVSIRTLCGTSVLASI